MNGTGTGTSISGSGTSICGTVGSGTKPLREGQRRMFKRLADRNFHTYLQGEVHGSEYRSVRYSKPRLFLSEQILHLNNKILLANDSDPDSESESIPRMEALLKKYEDTYGAQNNSKLRWIVVQVIIWDRKIKS